MDKLWKYILIFLIVINIKIVISKLILDSSRGCESPTEEKVFQRERLKLPV